MYTGEFVRSMFEGQGRLTKCDGKVFKGLFRNDKYVGNETPQTTVETSKSSVQTTNVDADLRPQQRRSASSGGDSGECGFCCEIAECCSGSFRVTLCTLRLPFLASILLINLTAYLMLLTFYLIQEIVKLLFNILITPIIAVLGSREELSEHVEKLNLFELVCAPICLCPREFLNFNDSACRWGFAEPDESCVCPLQGPAPKFLARLSWLDDVC